MKRETLRQVRDLAYYSSLGLSVSLSIFIGLFFGIWLDGKTGATPWFTLIFLGFGIAAGFRNIALVIRKNREK